MNLSTLSADLAAIKAASGSTAKKALAATWTTTAHAELLDLIGNTNRQWFITWNTVLDAQAVEDGIEWEDLWREAETRACSPTITAGRVRALLNTGVPENVLKAIVEKTPDCGLTVREFHKARGIRKPFAIALAADWLKMTTDKREALLATRKYASSVKMDGLRMAAVLANGRQEALSRSMKPLKNQGKLLAKLAKMFAGVPIVLDGEILSASNSWNDTVTGTKKDGAVVKLVYHIFDCVPYDEYVSGNFKMPKAKRLKLLDTYLKPDEEIVRVQFEPVFNCAEVAVELEAALQKGWEGVVLHDMTAVYRPQPDKAENRTIAWIKVKEFLSAEFKCIGFLAGTGKHLGRLGSIVVEGVVDGITLKSEVGTGFTDSMREEIWAHQSAFLGKTAEVKYFQSTKHGPTHGSLRFPSFLRWRDDL